MTELLNQDGESTPATLSQFGGTGESAMVYDGAGNRTSMPASIPGAPSSYSGTTVYTYEDNGGHTAPSWLTGESSTRLSGYSQSSSYDGAGNPTSFTGTSNSFNADNQNVADTFDGNGNPTTYRSSTCAYDEENRAVSLGSALTAGYDGDGFGRCGNSGHIYRSSPVGYLNLLIPCFKRCLGICVPLPKLP